MAMITALTVGAGLGATTYYFVSREDMKQRDAEIEQEREREREREKELQLHRQPETTALMHFSHKCPLTEVYCSAKGICCDACREAVSGWVYSCKSCYFHLHKVCARNPVTLAPCMDRLAQEMSSSVHETTTIGTFAHSDHLVKEIYTNVDYKCKHCFTPGCGKRFRCDTCKVNLHPVCATCPTKILSFMHPEHELELRTKRHFKDCAICNRDMGPNIRLYRCKQCKFYVHPACSQLPQYLLHDLHPVPHPLILKPATSSSRCDASCGNKCKRGGWCYECQICKVSFHVDCLLKRSIHGASEKTSIDEIIQLLDNINGVVSMVQAQ